MFSKYRSKLLGSAAAFALAALVGFVAPAASVQGAVTLSENADTYTLDNGTVSAMVAKASGDLVSLKYKGTEMLATFEDEAGKPDLQKDPPGENLAGLNRGMTDHQYGFWSHDAMGQRAADKPAIAKITIDPKANGGERAEVSVKGISGGRLMGTGPGGAGGNFISDIEIRWALGKDDSGVYTYCVFTHPADYDETSIGEARFCAKLAPFFDWLSAGDKYNKPYPKEQEKGEDKYVYTNVQSEDRAFGWGSTTNKTGFYLINPSMEYISGGPTKVEFLGHRDTNAVAAPCVLNYWRSSHYGGAVVEVAKGEAWSKMVGPFMLYVNSGAEPKALYEDARAQAVKEEAKWPYSWVKSEDYPNKEQRSTVSGRLNLTDPQAPEAKLPNLEVGLTHPAWSYQTTPPPPPAPRRGGPAAGASSTATTRAGGPARAGAPRGGRAGGPFVPRTVEVDWQRDAKYYEFWAKGKDDGSFSIPDVRAGKYTLHAFADGVLGELAKADVTIEAGKPLDLGTIEWTPVRQGKQIWQIGVPNRTGIEFFKGEDYAVMDISLQYAKLFPNDIHYAVGKSDFAKDWFFQQVPHNTDPNAVAAPFFGIRGEPGKATPYTVVFNMGSAPKGKATLRLAICATGTNTLGVSVNGQEAGNVGLGIGDGTITRHQIHGLWYERELEFDASMLKQGANELTITVPAGPVNNGVIYDCLRLEVDDAAAPPAIAAASAAAPAPEG